MHPGLPAQLVERMQMCRAVSLLHYPHVDDSYYVVRDADAGRERALTFLHAQQPLRADEETVTDAYFSPPQRFAAAIESLRVRQDSHDPRRCWLIAKLAEGKDTSAVTAGPRHGRMHRHVAVFEFADGQVGEIGDALATLGFLPSIVVTKRRWRFTMFDVPRVEDGRQGGKYLRVTLDDILSVVRSPSAADAQVHPLPSTAIVEAERSVDALNPDDDARYAAFRQGLLACFAHDALVPKVHTKFWHVTRATAEPLADARADVLDAPLPHTRPSRITRGDALTRLHLDATPDELADALAERRKSGVPIQAHPLGFLRLPITARGREDNGLYLHIWPRRATVGPCPMGSVHVHIFHLRSRILCGHLTDLTYSVDEVPGQQTHLFDVQFGAGEAWTRVDLGSVRCALVNATHHGAGDVYTIPRGHFHRTLVDGSEMTATLMEKTGVDLSASPFLVERLPRVGGVEQPKEDLDPERGWSIVDAVLAQMAG